MSEKNRHGAPPKEAKTSSKQREESNGEDSEETVMFEKRCTLGWLPPGSANINWHLFGTEKIKIVYDDEMLCCRVHFADQNGKWLFGNVIDERIKLKIEHDVCIWSCYDYITERHEYRTVRAQFSSSMEAQDFATVFAEAQEIGVAKWKNWK